MAKVKGGIGLALSGKLGGIVLVQMNGESFTRSLPRRTKDSVTPLMLQNQQRFREVNRYCKQFSKTVIARIWQDAKVKMSGYALFLKTNMAAFAKDGSLADPKKIRLSIGKLPLPQQMQAHRQAGEPSLIEVSWQKDLQVDGLHQHDELMVVRAANGLYSDITATGITR